MSSFINQSPNKNNFFVKEYIDKEKLMTKIFKNIESKTKIIEKYKNKYYNSNNLLDSIILGKLEFLELLNDFEEIISQSLQGMRSLYTELRNLKDKKEVDNKMQKKKNNILKNNSFHMEKSYSAYLNKCATTKDNKEEKENNKSQLEPKESFYMNIYGQNKNNNMSKNNFINLYYKKNTHYLSQNNKNSIFNKKYKERTAKVGARNSTNENKNVLMLNKNISNDSSYNKDIVSYDLSLTNNLIKENQNQSSFINNNDYNTINVNSNNQYRKILRLELKNKKYNNNKFNQNNSMIQRYELELENTENENPEKIEVDVKFPIRQGLKKNNRKKSGKPINYKNNFIDAFNYNSNKNDVIEKIKKDIQIKNYFSKKYGDNNFGNFLSKIWKNKLDLKEIDKELNILIKNKKAEEKYDQMYYKKLN